MAEKIVIDAGHGGSNPGAVYQGRRESDDALRLALAVGQLLDEDGYDVTYTRTSDVTQSVGQKAAIANEEGADLFISIHRNAAEYPNQYNGVQSLIYDDSGIKKEIAENINANLAALGFRDVGVSIRPNLVVLNSTQMPAVLVEAGFIDSDKDNQLFDTRFQAIAQGIADGISETLKEAAAESQKTAAAPVAAAVAKGAAEQAAVETMAAAAGNRPGSSCPVCPVVPDNAEPDRELYRVQAGAFQERGNADQLQSMLESDGFPSYIIYQDGLYKVQAGAFARLSNAIALEREMRTKGYNTYITT